MLEIHINVIYLSTDDGVVDYGDEKLYWGRSDRVWRLRSLLETVW